MVGDSRMTPTEKKLLITLAYAILRLCSLHNSFDIEAHHIRQNLEDLNAEDMRLDT